MDVGDIVAYQEKRWKVLSQDRYFRTCALSTWEGERVEVPADLDSKPSSGLSIVHRPSTWPFVSVPAKTRLGRIVEIRRQGDTLIPFEDWVPGGLFSLGGPIFFNPALGLCAGEVLAAHHEKGASRITVTKAFGTARHKKRRAAGPWRPPKPVTAYDRLMGDDDPFGDE